MTTNVNRFADVLYQAVNGVTRASVGQGQPPVAWVTPFVQSLYQWDDSLPLVTVDASAASVSQTLDGGAQRDDYAFDINIYGQTPKEVAEVVDLVEGYLRRNARTWDEVEGQRTDEANYEFFYAASIRPTAFQPATARSTSGGGGGVPADGSVGFNQLSQGVRDAINAAFVAVQPDGLDAAFITQGGARADDDRTLGRSVALFALGGLVGSITKVNNSLHITTYDRDGVQTVTTISLPSGSGASSHTDLQIEHLAAGEITQALLGVTYDPGTQAFGGRRQTTANYPLQPEDLAANAVVDKLTADLANAGKLAALQTLLAAWTKLKVLSAVPATAGYQHGDMVNVNGDVMELVAHPEDANVIGGIAGHDGQSFIGADNVPDGAEYGTINGDIVASVTWANATAEGVPLVAVQLPIPSAGAPSAIYMRLTTERGEDSDHLLNRDTDHDSTTNEGDVIGYRSGTTGERAGIGVGDRFEARFFTDVRYSSPLAIHTADRFESWLVRNLGRLDIPSDADIQTLAEAAAAARFTDDEKTKLSRVSPLAVGGDPAARRRDLAHLANVPGADDERITYRALKDNPVRYGALALSDDGQTLGISPAASSFQTIVLLQVGSDLYIKSGNDWRQFAFADNTITRFDESYPAKRPATAADADNLRVQVQVHTEALRADKRIVLPAYDNPAQPQQPGQPPQTPRSRGHAVAIGMPPPWHRGTFYDANFVDASLRGKFSLTPFGDLENEFAPTRLAIRLEGEDLSATQELALTSHRGGYVADLPVKYRSTSPASTGSSKTLLINFVNDSGAWQYLSNQIEDNKYLDADNMGLIARPRRWFHGTEGNTFQNLRGLASGTWLVHGANGAAMPEIASLPDDAILMVVMRTAGGSNNMKPVSSRQFAAYCLKELETLNGATTSERVAMRIGEGNDSRLTNANAIEFDVQGWTTVFIGAHNGRLAIKPSNPDYWGADSKLDVLALGG